MSNVDSLYISVDAAYSLKSIQMYLFVVVSFFRDNGIMVIVLVIIVCFLSVVTT